MEAKGGIMMCKLKGQIDTEGIIISKFKSVWIRGGIMMWK